MCVKGFIINMSLSNLFLSSIFLLLCVSFIACEQTPLMPNMDKLEKIPFKGKPVSPCRACRSLVKSFLKAIEDTNRKSFDGGDANWERQKLGKYENSELRFIEIQEKTCADVGRGKDQCYNLAEIHEEELEEYFFEQRLKNVDLLELLCINKLQICCPDNTYGPDCIPCPGGIEAPCGGHGKCLNGGTKDEPASCFCDAGYTGDLCDECGKGYYQEEGVSTLSCKLCDRACKGHCRGPGPQNCEVCAFGYRFIPNEGCVGHFDDYRRKIVITPNLSKKDENKSNVKKEIDSDSPTDAKLDEKFQIAKHDDEEIESNSLADVKEDNSGAEKAQTAEQDDKKLDSDLPPDAILDEFSSKNAQIADHEEISLNSLTDAELDEFSSKNAQTADHEEISLDSLTDAELDEFSSKNAQIADHEEISFDSLTDAELDDSVSEYSQIAKHNKEKTDSSVDAILNTSLSENSKVGKHEDVSSDSTTDAQLDDSFPENVQTPKHEKNDPDSSTDAQPDDLVPESVQIAKHDVEIDYDSSVDALLDSSGYETAQITKDDDKNDSDLIVETKSDDSGYENVQTTEPNNEKTHSDSPSVAKAGNSGFKNAYAAKHTEL